MEVGIRQGVCNNSPAESTGPENGWRWSVGPIPGRSGNGRVRGSNQARTSRRAVAVRVEVRERSRAEPPRVQILVVVANIQTGTLKAEVEKGSTGTALERGSVGPKRRDNSRLKRVRDKERFPNPPGGRGRDEYARAPSKGNRVNIPEPGRGERPLSSRRRRCGDANEAGDVVGGPGKSSLFFVRSRDPGIGSPGERDGEIEKRRGSAASGAPPPALENPAETTSISRRAVPESAAGLLGSQPLVDGTM